ncbi:hypothetical protein CAPTEDRAFT_213730 [Capitella teleta]|uniref:Uncharacterized protein n=1 Tax=Capitella teleta TaxID=283909 RepID=R7TNX2_CAPTE|nr:hypothetical protein CAPTEDRAFT_213730 [Capitella teleta]|eukprot:ELT92755.1 hypothetical protein CAPTEDRAFT_213730 [Capitella teleta]
MNLYKVQSHLMMRSFLHRNSELKIVTYKIALTCDQGHVHCISRHRNKHMSSGSISAFTLFSLNCVSPMKREQFLAKYNLKDSIAPVAFEARTIRKNNFHKAISTDANKSRISASRKISRSDDRAETGLRLLWYKHRQKIREAAIGTKDLGVSNSWANGKENLQKNPVDDKEVKHPSQKRLTRGHSKPCLPLTVTSPKLLRRTLSLRSLPSNRKESKEATKASFSFLPKLHEHVSLTSKDDRLLKAQHETNKFSGERKRREFLENGEYFHPKYARIRQWVENCSSGFQYREDSFVYLPSITE